MSSRGRGKGDRGRGRGHRGGNRGRGRGRNGGRSHYEKQETIRGFNPDLPILRLGAGTNLMEWRDTMEGMVCRQALLCAQ